MDCGVVGQPSECNGEDPVAFRVPSPKGTTLPQEQVRQTLLAHVSASVSELKLIREVYFIDKIPRNGNRKTMRNDLKRLLPK